MKRSRISAIVVGLASVTVAAAALLVPEPAEAEQGLFRALWTWYWRGGTWGGTPGYILPPSKGPDKASPAAGYVGNTTIDGKAAHYFTIPRGALRFNGVVTWYCKPGTCYGGYVISGGVYTELNGQGRFRPNNPQAATMTTTLRFPTTMSSVWPPMGAGDPRTPTTTFPYFRWNNYTAGGAPTPSATYRTRGNYDFNRAGSVQIWPGPHRFGGTIRWVYGENGFWYQLITRNSPWLSRVFFNGTPQWQPRDTVTRVLSDRISGGYGTRFRYTSNGTVPATTPNGATVNYKAQYIDTGMPWTTGKIRAYQPLGTYVTTLTFSGYDNRTLNGLAGKISLVEGRLRHSYTKPSDTSQPIRDVWHAARVNRFDVTFGYVPEPGFLLMLGAGVATLAGLAVARFRRR